MCRHIYTYSSQYRDTGRAKEIKKPGQQGMPRAKEILLRAMGSAALS